MECCGFYAWGVPHTCNLANTFAYLQALIVI